MFTTVFRSTFPQFAETNNEGHWMQVRDKRSSAEMEQDNAAKRARHDNGGDDAGGSDSLAVVSHCSCACVL